MPIGLAMLVGLGVITAFVSLAIAVVATVRSERATTGGRRKVQRKSAVSSDEFEMRARDAGLETAPLD